MRSNDGMSVVQRIVRILDCFLEGHPQTLSEVSLRAGIPQSTVLRLLRELVSADYVSHEPASKRYCAGLRILQLSESLKNRIDVRAVAMPLMLRLADETKETIQLVIVVGNQGVCIEKVDGSEPIRLYSEIGRVVPLYGGAATKAILAFLNDRQRSCLLSERLEALTPNTKTERCSIEAEIDQIRLSGVAVSREELAIGVAGVGAPIFDHTGNVVAGLCVAGPSLRLDERAVRRFGGSVKRAADEISRQMGYRSPN